VDGVDDAKRCHDRFQEKILMSNQTARPISRFIRRPRFVGSAVLGLVCFAGFYFVMPAARAMLLSFNISALVFLSLMIHVMVNATPQKMRHQAQLQDQGKWAVLIAALIVAAVICGALSFELKAAKDKSIWSIALAASSIFLSWMFVAVVFSQRYAHDFFLTPNQLIFPGTEHPDYFDFLYFSLVLSMCFQTSDVVVNSSNMRRLVTVHSVVSFFFNVIIIAITINVVASVL
jgi:uncharacterized membrane protein